MTNDFCDLPQELQIRILSNLDAVSLIHCAMLHWDGLKDAGTSLSHSELIESLTRKRQAWLSLEKKKPLIRKTQPNCEVYELAGGAFAHTSNNHLEITWLPTASNASGHTLGRPSIGIFAGEFTMDPTQDLIVFLEDDGTPPSTTNARNFRIHIRTISTNEIHPQARQSPLQLSVIPKFRGNTIRNPILQIAYDVFAVHFRNSWEETRALVWDWTTSDLLLDTSTPFDGNLPSLEYDFRLLDSTFFYITSEAICGAIRLYKLVRSRAATAQAIHLTSLYLPPPSGSPDVTIVAISSHAGPIEAHPLPNVPFMIHDDDRLHMLTVQYKYRTSSGRKVSYLNLFLHQRLLMDYAHRALTENLLRIIPWTEWGPLNTRLTISSYPQYSSCWKRYIHGQRAAFAKRLMGAGGPLAEPSRSIEVYDFSLAAVMSAKGIREITSPLTSSKNKPGALLPPSTIRTTDIPLFGEDVETHLPCVVSTLDLKRTYATCMIYGDGIIGVNVNADVKFSLEIYPV